MEFFDALIRYEVALWSAIDRELTGRGQIGLSQLYALRMLAAYDGRARVQDLSNDIGITVGAASKLVDRLERDGLARRSPNPANRRSSLIGLTVSGRRALRSATRVLDRALASVLGDEDPDALVAALGRLKARLDGSGVGFA
jgi:DNA-binding MarR family transcriptional regulator